MKKSPKPIKTGSYEQIKSFIIAILMIVVLVIVALGADKFRIGAGEAAVNDYRIWPSFEWVDPDDQTPVLSIGNGAINNEVISLAPAGATDIVTPYAFINITSPNPAYLYGQVYYAPGRVLPKLLNSGDFASATPSGNYVFCIQVIAKDATGKPLVTIPVKIDTRPGSTYGVITPISLEGIPGEWPLLWNAILPAKNGSDYIYTAMNADVNSPDYLTGQIVIAKNETFFAKYSESVIQPAFSSDGKQIAFVSKLGIRKNFGNADLHVLDLNTNPPTSRRIYDANSVQECAGPSVSSGITIHFVAFSLIGKDPVSNLLRQYVYVNNGMENKSIDMTQLPVGIYYNWNSNVKINEAGSGIVWQAKKERIMGTGNRAYNILAAALFPLNSDIGDAFQLFAYDAQARRRLPDLDNSGFVIFSNWMGMLEVPTNPNAYAIYGAQVKGLKETSMFPIINPIGMDFGATFTTQ